MTKEKIAELAHEAIEAEYGSPLLEDGEVVIFELANGAMVMYTEEGVSHYWLVPNMIMRNLDDIVCDELEESYEREDD